MMLSSQQRTKAWTEAFIAGKKGKSRSRRERGRQKEKVTSPAILGIFVGHMKHRRQPPHPDTFVRMRPCLFVHTVNRWIQPLMLTHRPLQGPESVLGPGA